ncbi:MAG: endonuclease NucS, partial [Candidatus Promineifilaceae bacterium]|nr:endonuclease NucS [Candidatus Promineifilaceae bacterium]
MTMYRKSTVQNQLYPVRSAPFSDHYHEEDLEALLEQNPQVLANDEPLLLISRQPDAKESGIPDLLALDADGNLVIVELKRGRPPRDVIAQALEYAAWAAALDEEGLHELANAYLARRTPPTNLTAAWQEAFGQGAPEDEETPGPMPALNGRQRIILVLEGREERVRHVVQYLRGFGIDINIVEYLYYRTDMGEEFLDIEAVHTP